MTFTNGGLAGPDGSGGVYNNGIETDRTVVWAAMGGRSGIYRGRVISTVVGSLSLSLSAGATLMAERDSSANELGRGYIEWSDTATVVTFGTPSVGVRKDALVAAFIDTEDGPVGSGQSVGPQILVVPGSSGSSTPLTNSVIQTALGRGGWLRLADVLISPGDTQINLSAVTLAGVELNRSRPLTVTAFSGWTINSQIYRVLGPGDFEIRIKATKATAAITADSGGNYAPNVQLASGLPTMLTPSESTYGTFENDGAKGGGVEITSGGNIFLLWSLPSTSITVGGTITVRVRYAVDQP